MQVPERLALIGGSILLASTLIFTLKSQASSILPKIEHPISTIYQHAGDAQKSSEFDDNFKQAQQKGWTIGQWGSSKYYIDDQHNMYVGQGALNGSLNSILGSSLAQSIHTLNFQQAVQAPQDSNDLLSTSLKGNPGADNSSQLTDINGLGNIDTSNTTEMGGLVTNDVALQHMDGLNTWNVSNVNGFGHAFNRTSLSDLDLSNWRPKSSASLENMLADNPSLKSLNISNFNTKDANMTLFFGSGTDNNLSNIVTGNETYLKNTIGISGNWNNGRQTISSGTLMASDLGYNQPVYAGNWHRIN